MRTVRRNIVTNMLQTIMLILCFSTHVLCSTLIEIVDDTINSLEDIRFRAEIRVQNYLQSAKDAIQKNNEKIIAELNLSRNQVQHCETFNQEMNQMISELAMNELKMNCQDYFMGGEQEDLKARLKKMYSLQDHDLLEEFQPPPPCDSLTEQPEQLRSCINHLMECSLFNTFGANETRDIYKHIQITSMVRDIMIIIIEHNVSKCTYSMINSMQKNFDFFMLDFADCCYRVAEDRGNSIF